jgi:hypothetical protein
MKKVIRKQVGNNIFYFYEDKKIDWKWIGNALMIPLTFLMYIIFTLSLL